MLCSEVQLGFAKNNKKLKESMFAHYSLEIFIDQHVEIIGLLMLCLTTDPAVQSSVRRALHDGQKLRREQQTAAVSVSESLL